MALVICSAGSLFDAACKSKLGDQLKALPDRYREECVARLDNGMIRLRPRISPEFLESFSRMVGGDYGLFHPLTFGRDTPNSKFPKVPDRFSMFAKAANVALLAEDPERYITFLSRVLFQLENFLDTVPHFASGREIDLKAISGAKLEKRKQFIALIEEDTVLSYRKLIELFRDIFIENGSSPKVALEKAYGRAVQLNVAVVLAVRENFDPGLQFGGSIEQTKNFLFDYGLYPYYRAGERILLSFDRGFSFGSVKGGVLNNPEDILRIYMAGYHEHGIIMLAWPLPTLTQHELQHALDEIIGVHSQPVDSEFRAKLAGRAFASPQDFEHYQRTLRSIKVEHPDPTNDDREDNRIHLEAESRVCEVLGSADPKSVMRVALAALDAEYLRTVGLSYQRILAPFRLPDLQDGYSSVAIC